jgi:2-(1,2-epoxy-1,2-dihydrophenyl)acetyl-CoA isomerase
MARRLYEALAQGDRQTLDAVLHPDFAGHATAGLPLGMGGTHTGPDAMRRGLWGRIAEHYVAHAEVTDMTGLSDGGLLVRGRYLGHARNNGRRLDAEFMHVLRFAGDGRIIALDQLTDSAAWRDALGDGAPLATVDYRVANGLATICLNRPDVRNAIDLGLAEDTLAAVQRIQRDPSVRAILVCGNGPAFSVGGDLHYIRSFAAAQYGNVLTQMTTPFHEAFRILARLDVPIITAAHGLVVGGGLGYIYAADLVLAAQNTTFLTAFADVGLSGDGGGTWHLPRIVGPRRAAQLYLENTPIDASTALDWGLVNVVVPDDELRSRAHELATRLAHGPTRAYARMRALLRTAWTNDLSTQLYAETAMLAETGLSTDAAGAIDAFAHKHRPHFTGS